MSKYDKFLKRVDLVRNQVERERIQEQEAAKKRKQRAQQQNRERWLRYQEQLRSELAARYFHGVVSVGGETDSVTPFVNEYSMSFDGVDEYAKGSSTFSELDGQTKATWSYWVKPTLGSTMVLSRVSNSTSTSDFVYMHFITSTGQLYASIGDTTRYSTAASNLLSNNTWSHVLICYNGTLANGSKTKIFINGVDSTSLDTTTATSLVSANYPLSVGRRDQTPTYYYNGFMDEVALWVGSDERANVADIYNSGVPSDLSQLTTPPSHWWRMGDGDSWDGSKWTLNDNIGSYNLESVNMEEGDRTTDKP